jgi:hypothetical protein
MARPKGVAETRPRRTAARKLIDAHAHGAAGDLPMPEMMRRIALARYERGDEDGALQAAEKAAPYFAPRLAATDVTTKGDRIGYVIAAPPEAEDAAEWTERHRPH